MRFTRFPAQGLDKKVIEISDNHIMAQEIIWDRYTQTQKKRLHLSSGQYIDVCVND